MSDVRMLFDRPRLDAQRKRARAMGPALFLHEEVAFDVQERLSEVNKAFTSPAIVTPWPEVWGLLFPEARVIPDDDTLALGPGEHDLVVHALSLHWANDPVGQLVQCRRALKPDGMLVAVCFGGETLSTLRQALAEAEVRLTGGLSPRVAPMGEIRDLGGLLGRAGFNLPVADNRTLTVTYRNLFHLCADLRQMGETNAMTDRLRRPTRRQVFLDAAEHYPKRPDGRIEAVFELITLTGWAPHDSQQKPLRPGSAVTRLADALGTKEEPTD